MDHARTVEDETRPVAGLAAAWLLAGLLAALFIFGVLLRPPLPIDETRYLSVAWEMHLSGDYFVPTRNGETYAHKPPLLFWLINAVWALTGVSELAARLVGPAFAVANLGLTFLLARRLFPDRPEIPPTAAAFLASLLVYAAFTGLTMFDAMLTTMTLVGLMGLWSALAEGKSRGWLVYGAALGFGVLTKGPVILLHTLPVVIGSRLWRSPAVQWMSVLKGCLVAVGLALAIIAVWLVPAVIFGGAAYRSELLWTQTANRVASAFDHGRPAWFFLALIPVYLFPWSFHLDFWKSVRRLDVSHSATRFLSIQIVAALAAFSAVASKQTHYLVPELPALAILAASVFPRQGLRTGANLAVIGTAAGAAVIGLALLVRPEVLSADQRPGSEAVGAAILIGFAAVSVALLRLRSVTGMALWTLASLAALNLWIAASPLGTAHSMREFTRYFEGRDGDRIAFYGKPYNAEFNFVGRLTRPVFAASSQVEVAEWAAAHPDGLVIAPLSAVPHFAAPKASVAYGSKQFGIWDAGEVANAFAGTVGNQSGPTGRWKFAG